jgi:aryl-alcohol dehydrogenase-like predicted oxidoreductase
VSAWGGGRTTQADDALGVATFQHALKCGMNYADTSPLYGESERRIGCHVSSNSVIHQACSNNSPHVPGE